MQFYVMYILKITIHDFNIIIYFHLLDGVNHMVMVDLSLPLAVIPT